MIHARFKVTEKDKPDSDRIYANLYKLLDDFPLEEEEINALFRGKDLEKWWAKRRWLITLMEPEE